MELAAKRVSNDTHPAGSLKKAGIVSSNSVYVPPALRNGKKRFTLYLLIQFYSWSEQAELCFQTTRQGINGVWEESQSVAKEVEGGRSTQNTSKRWRCSRKEPAGQTWNIRQIKGRVGRDSIEDGNLIMFICCYLTWLFIVVWIHLMLGRPWLVFRETL